MSTIHQRTYEMLGTQYTRHLLHMCVHVLHMCVHVLHMCVHVLHMCVVRTD